MKILLETETGLLDVTDRMPLIYGAGEGFMSLHWEILNRAHFVVDDNPARQDTLVTVCGRELEILSPERLAKFDPETVYIIIPAGNDKYIAEMKAHIACISGEDGIPVTVRNDNVSVRYASLDEFFAYDLHFRKRLDRWIPAAGQWEYLEKCRRILAQTCDKPIVWVASTVDGTGCDFFVGTARGEYVMKLPKHYPEHPDRSKEILRIKREYGLEQSLTIYEDEEGFCVQRRADGVPDFRADETVRQVLRKFRMLHTMGGQIDRELSAPEKYHEMLSVARAGASREQRDLLDTVTERLGSALELCGLETERRLCHGDLYYGNVLYLEGEPIVIDWETMTMTDPLYDVCYFLCSIPREPGVLYRELKSYLSCYWDRACTEDEFRRARAMLAVCGSVQLCHFYHHTHRNLCAWTQTGEDRTAARAFRLLELFA